MAAIATVAQVTTAADGIRRPLVPVRPGFFRCNRVPGNSLDLEASVVERCLSGDETAWEDLVKVYTKRVYAICYRFTGNDSEAQDLTQEVFLRVFKTLRTFRAGEGSLVVWLTRLSRNLLIDHYRRTKIDRVTDSIENQLPMLEEKSATSSRTDGLLAGREASEVLQAALQKLSPELRETVILRDLEEMEYRGLVRALGGGVWEPQPENQERSLGRSNSGGNLIDSGRVGSRVSARTLGRPIRHATFSDSNIARKREMNRPWAGLLCQPQALTG